MITPDLLLALTLVAPQGAQPGFRELVVDPSFSGGAAITSGDFDGDGRVDLAAASYYDDRFSWYRNRGNGGFERRDVFALNGAFSIESADLDGDGDLDLYGSSITSSEYGEDTVWWFENRVSDAASNEAEFSPRQLYTFPNQDPQSMDAADFDGDGNLDLAVAFVYDSNLHLFLNPTGEGPSGPPILVHSPAVNGCSVVHGEDFDGDGDVDLVAGTAWDSVTGNNVYWFPNLGGAAFGERITIAGGDEFGGMFSMQPADVDGDGRMDVITSADGSYGNPVVRWIPRLDDAGTAWDLPRVIDDAFWGSGGDQGLHVADLDADGDLDLLGGSFLIDPRVRAWINAGDGSFRPVDVDVGFGAHGVTAVDLDADGVLELVGSNWGGCCYSGAISIWKVVH